MKFFSCDIWDFFDAGRPIMVTTNIGWDGETCRNNMGAGTVMEAAARYPWLPVWYGAECYRRGANTGPIWHPGAELILFPVKPLKPGNPADSWNQKADLSLIAKGLKTLARGIDRGKIPNDFALTLPGAGNGRLDPQIVLPLVKAYLGRFPGLILCDRQIENLGDTDF